MSELEQQVSMSKSHNRRSVVKGAAWSIPVIAAAVAAPAASASVVLPEQPTNLTIQRVAWNDGANGNAAIQGPSGPYYPANFGLFFDTVYTNTGSSIITGIQFASSLEMAPHDFVANPPTSIAIHNGTVIQPSSTTPKYDQNNLGLRWVQPSQFNTLALAPGETIIFRTNYRTTTVAGINKPAAPYGTAIVFAVTPTAGFSASPTETTHADNSGSVVNPYTVTT